MKSIRNLKIFYLFVLSAMLVVTFYATRHENVWNAFLRLSRDPWGLATLFDAYFGFITVYLWICYREKRLVIKIIWLLLVLTFGNIAIAIYFLMALFRLSPGQGMADLLIRKEP